MYSNIAVSNTEQVQFLDETFSKIHTIIVKDYLKDDDDFQKIISIDYHDIKESKDTKVNICVSSFDGNIEVATSDNIKYFLKLKRNSDNSFYLYLENKSINDSNNFEYTYKGFIKLVEYLYTKLFNLQFYQLTNKDRIKTIKKAQYLYCVGFGFEHGNAEIVLKTNFWKKALLARLGIFEE